MLIENTVTAKIEVWATALVFLEFKYDAMPSPPTQNLRKEPFQDKSPYANERSAKKHLEDFLKAKANHQEGRIPEEMAILLDDMLEHGPDERSSADEAL